MKEMQFTAMVLMMILAATLAWLLPDRAERDAAYRRSRWLTAGGLMLMAVQFLLQYVYGFRQMGVTQGVMVNLLFFIPTSVLISLAFIGLQRQGRLTWREWLPGVAAWGLTIVLLGGAAFYTGDLLADTQPMRRAEYAAGLVYLVMQSYYSWRIKRGNNRLSRALQNYYDRDMDDMLTWMHRAVNLLLMIALFVPFLIFSSGWLLMAYALLIFLSIYYLVFSFICYGVAGDAQRVQAAEENATETKGEEHGSASAFSDEDRQRIEAAVNRWLAQGGHLRSGLTHPEAAQEIGIPRHQLSAWLKTTPEQLFKPWLTRLRIDEAKHLLCQHPDWQLESIARRCGFKTANYFHEVFKKQTGLTPTEWLSQG